LALFFLLFLLPRPFPNHPPPRGAFKTLASRCRRDTDAACVDAPGRNGADETHELHMNKAAKAAVRSVRFGVDLIVLFCET